MPKGKPAPRKSMTTEEWVEKQLAKAPRRDAEWIKAMMLRFNFPPEEIQARYQQALQEDREYEAAERAKGEAVMESGETEESGTVGE
ncbi:hypothetical protein ACWD6I_10545 [Streptomyces sp. NPDC002454]